VNIGTNGRFAGFDFLFRVPSIILISDCVDFLTPSSRFLWRGSWFDCCC